MFTDVGRPSLISVAINVVVCISKNQKLSSSVQQMCIFITDNTQKFNILQTLHDALMNTDSNTTCNK